MAFRFKFNILGWREGKEPGSEFYARFRSATLVLPGKSSYEVLLDCFVHSLPPNMLNLALSISGTPDEVTAGVLMTTLDAT